MKSLTHVFMLFSLIWLVQPAFAAPSCGPVQTLKAGSQVTFHAQDNPTLLFRGTLAYGLRVGLGGETFGFDNGSATQKTTRKAVEVDSAVVQGWQLKGGGLVAWRDGVGDHLIIRQGNTRFQIPILAIERSEKRQAVESYQLHSLSLPVVLLPDSRAESDNKFPAFSVPVGTQVKSYDNEATIFPPGTVLEWGPGNDKPLKLSLAQDVTLPVAAGNASTAVVSLSDSGRAAPGHEIQLLLTQPGADLRNTNFDFCVTATDTNGNMTLFKRLSAKPLEVLTGRADTVRYQLQLPEEFKGLGKVDASPWIAWLYEGQAHIEVVGLAASGLSPSLIASTPLKVVRVGAAVGLGVAVVVLALMIFGSRFVGVWRPTQVLARMVQTKSGRYSLSNFQILLWTLLVLFSMTYVWLIQAQIIGLPEGILVLLGISGTTSVLARGVANLKAGNSAAGTPAVEEKPKEDPKLTNLVSDNEQEVDLLRFQMLGFTVFAWLYVLESVISQARFPELPANLYWLMGVSSATYVGGKLRFGAQPAPAGDKETALAQIAENGALIPSTDQIKQVQTKLGVAPVTGVQDAKTLAAVQAFEKKVGAIRTDGKLTSALIKAIMDS